MMGKSALLVGDKTGFLEAGLDTLSREGIDLTRTSDTTQALDLVRRRTVDVVIIELPKASGKWVDTIHEFKGIQPEIPIIVCQSESSCETISEELDGDVFEFLPMPVNFKSLLRKVKHAIERSQLISDNRRLTRVAQSSTNTSPQHSSRGDGSEPALDSTTPLLVGESEAMQRVERLIAEVAPSDMTVLLRGETGTGKDIVARQIHRLSSRGESRPFIKICCPAVPEPLLESELFGHEPGAFTGADRRKPGRLELAAGGTVFLDEIGEMPPTVQSKLLEALEHRQFTRLGGTDPIKINTRFIAATNSPLEGMLDSGRFRQDLYFRLNQFTIELPPLRERVEDIPLLIDFFLKKYGCLYGREGLFLSSETISKFVLCPWRGNVRELESAIRRFALTGREETATSLLLGDTPATTNLAGGGIYHSSEKMVIMSALTAARWNRRLAAKNLGISYSTLRRRIDRYRLNDIAFKISDSAEKIQQYELSKVAFEIIGSA